MPIPTIAYAAVIAVAPIGDPPPTDSPVPAATIAPAPATDTAAPTVPSPVASAPVPAGGDVNPIIVQSKPRPVPADPFAHANVEVFGATQSIDTAIIRPAAIAYARTVPSPIRFGLRNVLNNLDEPVIALNFLLQLNPGRALGTVLRFAINSTMGWGGLFDPAKGKGINLPRRPNGFADTLGVYGVKPGPYFFLPVVGATTLRDFVGGIGDMAASGPRWVGKPFSSMAWSLPTGIATGLETRVEFDRHLHEFRDSERGAYISEREYYFRLRAARIAAHKAGDKGPPVDDVPAIVAPFVTVPAKP